MMIDHADLSREGIVSLDQTLYVASCFAASSPDRKVTILGATTSDLHERYRVVDGVAGADTVGGLDYAPVYVIERPDA